MLSISSPDDLTKLAIGGTATFDVSVSGTSADAPGYLSASVQYDSTVFGNPVVSAGSIVPDLNGFDSSGTVDGTINATYDDSIYGTAAITTDGVFYAFTLTRLSGAATSLSFSAFSAQDDSGNGISISTSPNSIDVPVNLASVPEPSSWVLALGGAVILGGRGLLVRERRRRLPRSDKFTL